MIGLAELSSRPPASLALRRAWVRALRLRLAANLDTLAQTIAEELGRPRWQTLTGELWPLLSACRWLERRGAGVLAPRSSGGGFLQGGFLGLGRRVRITREPLGRVAIIATWNYPIQLLGIQLAQAVFAGNRVVVKPSENAPRSQALLLALAREALAEVGLDAGTIEFTEPTRAAGERLLLESCFDHVIFTGSTAVGRAIAQRLAPSLTPSTLELSGRDSAFVLEGADVELAALALFGALCLNAGQTCMAPRRVLVQRAAYQPLLLSLAALAAGAKPVRLISEHAATELYTQCLRSLRQGARTLQGVVEPPWGRTMRPVVLVDCPAGADLVAGAHFGPAMAVVPVESVREAVEIHAACDQHLATSIFGPASAARALASELASKGLTGGVVTINDVIAPTGLPGVSIAGRGPSGWGISRGAEGLLALTRPVTLSHTAGPIAKGLWKSASGVPAKMEQQMASFLRWWYGGGAQRGIAGDGAVNHPGHEQRTVPAASDPGAELKGAAHGQPERQSSVS
jgi:acyl-CoA reductase-like NAD-dependent aldehyde dehydrogenase